MAKRVRRLYRELDKRQISFRPHVWLSEEWFSPDGVPGIAVPFYLAHPRLERLERRMMRNVEGGSAESAMRILRHEAGHAIDTAYRLRRRKRWREIFGPASLPYPDTYRARARQPPLRAAPRASGTRRRIPARTSPRPSPCGSSPTPRGAARMRSGRRSTNSNSSTSCWRTCAARARRCAIAKSVEPLRENTRTLADHYRRKLRRYSMYRRTVTDHLLERVFTAERTSRARRARALSCARTACTW